MILHFCIQPGVTTFVYPPADLAIPAYKDRDSC